MYNRSDFLNLINMDAERFKSLARRGQLPFAEGDRDDKAQPSAKWRQFTPFEALLSILTEDFVFQFDMSRNLAIEITSRCAQDMWSGWPELTHTVVENLAGNNSGHFYIAAAWQDGTAGHPRLFCGSANEIAHKAEEAGAFGIVAVSATRAALTLKANADKHGIEIPTEFWGANIPGPAHVERDA